MELDLQPVMEEEPLDLQPLDLQPVQETQSTAAQPVGQLRGVANAFKRGVIAAQRNFDVLQAKGDKSNQPTLRQERRAFESAMNDPGYQQRLIAAQGDSMALKPGDPASQPIPTNPRLLGVPTDFIPAEGDQDTAQTRALKRMAANSPQPSRAAMSRVEMTRGPQAKLEQAMRPAVTAKEGREFDIAAGSRRMEAIPKSATMQRWDAAGNEDWYKVLASDPVEVIANITAESLPQSLAGMAGGAVAGSRLGPVGAAVGMGAGSLAMEYASSLVEGARTAGYDFNKEEDVRDFFRNEQAVEQASLFALKRGVPIAVLDGVSAKVAGRFLGPAIKQGGVKAVAKASGKELATQMTAGAYGEAAAQTASGQELSAKDIAAEALGELASGPSEVVTNIRGEMKRVAERAKVDVAEVKGDLDLEEPVAEVQTEPELEVELDLVPVETTPEATAEVQSSNLPEVGGLPRQTPEEAAMVELALAEAGLGNTELPEDFALPVALPVDEVKLDLQPVQQSPDAPGQMEVAPESPTLSVEEAAPEAPTAPPPTPEAPKPKAVRARAGVAKNTPGSIEDFGEKLGGARKDMAPSISKEFTDDEIAAAPLSKIWPKTEVETIEDILTAAIAHAIRAEIPAKPRQGYKLRRWVERVKLVRTIMKHVMERGAGEVMTRMGDYKLGQLVNKINLLRELPRSEWRRVGAVEYFPDAYSYVNNQQVASPIASAEVDGKRIRATNLDELAAKVKEEIKLPSKGTKMQFEVRGREDRGFFINKKGDPLYRKLKKFEDAKAALAFARDPANQDELTKAWDAIKETDNVRETDVRGEVNRPRVGANHRKGRDATPEMFMQAFGFRGVEFGNWVSQGSNTAERQGMLNAAYDALFDLASILGIPTRSISLNGTLGIGFGSRGHGWASAHYEPDTLVINLTKTRGAGALAHEWFHALDNYFQRYRNSSGIHGREGDYITKQPETYYENAANHRLTEARFKELQSKGRINTAEWQRVEGVRVEVAEAFNGLVKALDESPMAKRAGLIDKGKSGGYWSSTIERAARSFENYTISKMQLAGYHNDYLANVVSPEDFGRDPGRYPYLLPEEVAPIASAFDNLFNNIKAVPESRDAMDAWLTQWIDKLALQPGALYEGVTSAPIWMTQAMLRTTLQVVRAAYRGGKALAAAIEDGIAYLKAQNIEGFNEDEVRPWLKETAGRMERRFPKQVDASGDISNEVRRRVTNRTYEKRSNESDAAFAQRIVEDAGGAVMAQAKYDSLVADQPGAIKGMVAGQIIKGLAGLEQEAAMLGLKVESDRMADLQGEFINRFSEEATDAGQFVQSLAAFARMTPQGWLSDYRRLVDGAEQKRLDEWKPVVDTVQTVLEEANKETLGDLGNSKQAQDAAQEAVDEGVKKSRAAQRIATRQASGRVMGQKAAAKALQERLAALIKPKLTLWEQYKGAATKTLLGAVRKSVNATAGPKAALDTFTQTLAAVLREQLDAQLNLKQPDGKPLPPPTYFSRLMNGLNNPEKYQEVWAETVKQLQELYPDNPNVQNLNPQQPQVFGEDILRGVINEHLAAFDISLREMIAGHYQAADGGRPLRDKIVEMTGLDGPQALELARVFDKVFADESAKVKAQLAAKVKAMRGDSRLMKMVRSGLVELEQLPTDDTGKELARIMRQQMVDINRVIRQHYTVQDATGRTLAAKLAQEAKLPPEQAEKFARVLEARFKVLATERKRKALAKLGTRTKVKLGNRPGLAQRLIELSNLGALDTQQYYDAVAEKLGLPVYSPEVAREIVKQSNALQLLPEGSIQQQRAVLNLMNYIARQKGFKWWEMPVAFWYANVLSGPTTQLVNAISNLYNLAANFGIQAVRHPADTFELLTALGEGFQKGKLDAKDVLTTGQITGTRLLKMEPGRPLELKQFTGWKRFLNAWKYVGRAMAAADMLFYKPAEEMKAYAAAKLAAEREGLQGEAQKARVREVLQKRPEQRLAAEAQATAEGLTERDHARRVEQLLEMGRPEALRETARDYALRVTFNNQPYGVLGALAQGVNWTAEKVPLLRLIVPFTNIVSNVVNESLNYFPPVGYGRALYGHWQGELQGKPITDPDAMYEQYAKATAGTAALAVAAMVFTPDPDDDDPERALYGAGPGNGAQRKQMMEAGWRPYSIKLGNRYYSYAQTPMALPFAVLGNYFDALRYRKLDEQDALNRAAYALSVSGKVITEQSFLSGVADLFTSMGRTSPKTSGETMIGGLARTGSSVVVPNALRQVDRLFDPTLYDTPTVQAALINQVPFVRSINRPALNALGEPVTSGVFARFTSGEIADPVWQMVARKGAWVSAPDQGELTDTQYYNMMKLRGERLRPRLEAVLPTLERMKPEEAKELVSQISEQETKRAKIQVKSRY
jgi:hypothetical protein